MWFAVGSLAAEAGVDLVNNPFTAFGVLGTMAGIGLWFIKRESARADRYETKLDTLEKEVRDLIVPAMAAQSQAIQQALDVLRDVARRQP